MVVCLRCCAPRPQLPLLLPPHKRKVTLCLHRRYLGEGLGRGGRLEERQKEVFSADHLASKLAAQLHGPWKDPLHLRRGRRKEKSPSQTPTHSKDLPSAPALQNQRLSAEAAQSPYEPLRVLPLGPQQVT